MKWITGFFLLTCSLILISCTNSDPGSSGADGKAAPPKPRINWKKASNNSYHLESSKAWVGKNRLPKDTAGVDIILAVNRTDSANLARLDSILVPDDLSGDPGSYMHFPEKISALREVKKLIFFSYPSQSFGAYEYGYLVQAGPTNMGSKQHPTPTGLFFSNWKALETTSTFNDEWQLKWNFNIENTEGVGWHQYALPGYPASHSCLRLQATDAIELYEWADQWKLEGTEKVLANGTPVIVFGTYPFDGPKPWLQLANEPGALDISESQLNQLVEPQLTRILAEQEKTDRYRADSTSAK